MRIPGPNSTAFIMLFANVVDVYNINVCDLYALPIITNMGLSCTVRWYVL